MRRALAVGLLAVSLVALTGCHAFTFGTETDGEIRSHPVTITNTTRSVTGTSSVALYGNASRLYMRLTNDSDTVMYFKLGANPGVVNEGFRLEANGGTIEWSRANGTLVTSQVNIIHGGAGSKNLLVAEGV